jgi:hypothetical protein
MFSSYMSVTFSSICRNNFIITYSTCLAELYFLICCLSKNATISPSFMLSKIFLVDNFIFLLVSWRSHSTPYWEECCQANWDTLTCYSFSYFCCFESTLFVSNIWDLHYSIPCGILAWVVFDWQLMSFLYLDNPVYVFSLVKFSVISLIS